MCARAVFGWRQTKLKSVSLRVRVSCNYVYMCVRAGVRARVLE